MVGTDQAFVAAFQDMIQGGDHLGPVFLEGAADGQIVRGMGADKLQIVHRDVLEHRLHLIADFRRGQSMPAGSRAFSR